MNILEEMDHDGRIKGVRCLCGDGFTMLARMPMAETERDIISEFAKYARKGRRIEMMKCTDKPSFCGCKAAAPAASILAPAAPANQLSLFATA